MRNYWCSDCTQRWINYDDNSPITDGIDTAECPKCYGDDNDWTWEYEDPLLQLVLEVREEEQNGSSAGSREDSNKL
jgi:hypothetical protein